MLDDRCYGAILSGKSTRVVGGKVLARKFSVGKMDRATYSAYNYDLDVQAKSRYRDKLAKVGIMTDPYLPSTASSIDWQDWPDVQYPDVYNYLIMNNAKFYGSTLHALNLLVSRKASGYALNAGKPQRRKNDHVQPSLYNNCLPFVNDV